MPIPIRRPTYRWPAPTRREASSWVVGDEDLHGQRVNVFGNGLWGAGGVTLTSLAGWQSPAAMTSDGFGGALVVYEDHYYSVLSDPFAHAVSALRIDAFANILWASNGFWWTQIYATPDWRVATPVIVADGSGGGHAIWRQYDDSWNRNWVYAAGLGADGATPPTPTLTALWPDGGAPGEVLGLQALGDYLDPMQTFALEQGGSVVPLTGVTLTGNKLVDGTVSLGSAPIGPYDLVCRDGGTPV